jgi:hypothetical protein
MRNIFECFSERKLNKADDGGEGGFLLFTAKIFNVTQEEFF